MRFLQKIRQASRTTIGGWTTIAAVWAALAGDALDIVPWELPDRLYYLALVAVAVGTLFALAVACTGRVMYTVMQLGRATEREVYRRREQVDVLT